MTRDYRDLTIEHVVDDEHDLHLYVRELEGDVRAYRELNQAALAHCHELTEMNGRLRAAVRRQSELIRTYLNVPSTMARAA